mmetsp:Transcript_31367/g.75583  ORF Transcript_31367/g.75583 Transcript_31367/m.75583 type:complete len:214 (-) Transcript_31367:1121-1762(-)
MLADSWCINLLGHLQVPLCLLPVALKCPYFTKTGVHIAETKVIWTIDAPVDSHCGSIRHPRLLQQISLKLLCPSHAGVYRSGNVHIFKTYTAADIQSKLKVIDRIVILFLVNVHPADQSKDAGMSECVVSWTFLAPVQRPLEIFHGSVKISLFDENIGDMTISIHDADIVFSVYRLVDAHRFLVPFQRFFHLSLKPQSHSNLGVDTCCCGLVF